MDSSYRADNPHMAGVDVSPSAARKQRLSSIHFILLFAMLGVVAALAWTTWSARALVLTFVPQVNAMMQTRVAVTEAHLWLEEIVSGDASEDPQQVRDLVADARWHLDAMKSGGTRGTQVVLPVNDSKLRDDIARAMFLLAEFERLALKRVDGARAAALDQQAAETDAGLPVDATPAIGAAAAGENPAAAEGTQPRIGEASPLAAIDSGEQWIAVGVGTDIDQRFDDAFEEYIAATLRIEQHLSAVMNEALTRFVRTQVALMAAIAVLFGWIIWLLMRKAESDRDAHVGELQASLAKLAHSQQELERQNALRGAMVEIADTLQGVDAPEDIARLALRVLCARSGAVVGVFWEVREGEGLFRLAGHALPSDRLALDALAEGEGLAGRAARDQQALHVDVPSDYLTVASALGASSAPHLRVLPLVHDRVSTGVIELVFLTPPDRLVSELLQSAAPAIAVRLHVAARAQRLSA